jgi:hypothetical protein
MREGGEGGEVWDLGWCALAKIIYNQLDEKGASDWSKIIYSHFLALSLC